MMRVGADINALMRCRAGRNLSDEAAGQVS
jgi:hypothetical protein